MRYSSNTLVWARNLTSSCERQERVACSTKKVSKVGRSSGVPEGQLAGMGWLSVSTRMRWSSAEGDKYSSALQVRVMTFDCLARSGSPSHTNVFSIHSGKNESPGGKAQDVAGKLLTVMGTLPLHLEMVGPAVARNEPRDQGQNGVVVPLVAVLDAVQSQAGLGSDTQVRHSKTKSPPSVLPVNMHRSCESCSEQLARAFWERFC